MKNAAWTLGLAVATLALAAGCGGDSPAPAPAPAPAGTPAPAAAPAVGGGAFDAATAKATIRVKATLKGNAPKLSPIDFSADDKGCGAQHKDKVFPETVVADGGKLANVIVYVSRGAERWTYRTDTTPRVIDQKGCTYHPHVFTVMTNQPVTIKNSDPTMHNIHAVTKGKQDFNHSMLNEKAEDIVEKFPKEELGLKIKCDIHGWMSSFVGVFSHPFHGVTGADGTASLKVPAGEYEIAAWHEYDKFGKPAAQKVTVADGETKDLEFVFEGR